MALPVMSFSGQVICRVAFTDLGSGPVFGMIATQLIEEQIADDKSQISGHLAP